MLKHEQDYLASLLREAEEKAAVLSKEISELETVAAFLRTKLKSAGKPVEADPPLASSKEAEANRAAHGRATVAGGYTEMIVNLLKRRPDHTARYGDMVDELKAEGAKSSSAKGIGPNIFSALARRPDLFEKVERGVYRLIPQS